MKLLHILPGFNSAMGGTLAFVKAWVQSESEEGVSSVVLALYEKSEPIPKEGCNVVGILSSPGTYRYSRELVPWLEKNVADFDAVVIHGIWQYHSFGAWRAFRRHSIPYFVFPHGMLDDWFRRTYPFKHLKKCIYWGLAESKVLRDARGVIFTSEDERASSKNAFFPYRIRDLVSPLGIPEPPSNVEEQQGAFYARYPGIQGKRMILFLGRLHCKKGCDLLIRAFAEVYGDRSEMILVMAGPEGEVGYERELRDVAEKVLPQSAERVIWTGMLEGNVKWGALRSAELFVLPSHQENFGIAVVESLACKTPVLISDRVNIWQEVKYGDAGLVESDTVEGMVSGLKRWGELGKEHRRCYQINARQLYESKFQIGPSVRRLNEIIRKSIA